MMLQYDGLMSNKCTCFMFLNPTTMSRSLLKKWEQEIINTGSDKNQVRETADRSLKNHPAVRLYCFSQTNLHLVSWAPQVWNYQILIVQ